MLAHARRSNSTCARKCELRYPTPISSARGRLPDADLGQAHVAQLAETRLIHEDVLRLQIAVPTLIFEGAWSPDAGLVRLAINFGVWSVNFPDFPKNIGKS